MDSKSIFFLLRIRSSGFISVFLLMLSLKYTETIGEYQQQLRNFTQTLHKSLDFEQFEASALQKL